MREGTRLMLKPSIRSIGINAIVYKLNGCCDKYKGCDDCPELQVCVEAYDKRCGIEWENMKRKGWKL